VVRLFHFAFGMLLYNLWRLVDFLIQLSMDGYEMRYKPRVKSKRFINAIVDNRLLG
jgi:IS4 transposase